LVVRAQAGDHEAFSALAAGSVSRLLAAARLILRDEDRAQDAVQEAMVDAWLDVRGLRDPDRWDAWVRRLLLRGCYRAAKRERNRRVVEVPRALGDRSRDGRADRPEPEEPDAQRLPHSGLPHTT